MRFVQSPSLVGGYGLFACGTETLNLPSNNLLRLIFSFVTYPGSKNDTEWKCWHRFERTSRIIPNKNWVDLLEIWICSWCDTSMLSGVTHYAYCTWLYDALHSLGVVGLESRDGRGEVEFPLCSANHQESWESWSIWCEDETVDVMHSLCRKMCVSSLPFGRGWLTLKEVTCMIVIAAVKAH